MNYNETAEKLFIKASDFSLRNQWTEGWGRLINFKEACSTIKFIHSFTLQSVFKYYTDIYGE